MQHTDEKGSSTDPLSVVEKWKGQIEKVSNCTLLGIQHFLTNGAVLDSC